MKDRCMGVFRAILPLLFSFTILVSPVLAQQPVAVVADFFNARVQTLSPNGIAAFSCQCIGPSAVAIDRDGNVYVTSYYGNSGGKVMKFDASGTLLSRFADQGSGDGEIADGAQGIAIDSAGNIYVADTFNSRIEKFNASGVYQLQFGSFGSGNGQFDTPMGIAVDGDGNMFVVDHGNYRVQKFSATGQYLSQFGSYGSNDGQFFSPFDIAIDPSGHVWVSEEWGWRVQKFDTDGVYQTQFGTFSWSDDSDSANQGIEGVDVDTTGNVYLLTNWDLIVLNGSGAFQSKQPLAHGSGDGEFDYPRALAISVGTLPTVTSLTPNFGNVGQQVTIAGTNFGATQGTSTVAFNGIAAGVTSWGPTSITAPVPAGATTGLVVVTVNGVASNGRSFTVGMPTGTVPGCTSQPGAVIYRQNWANGVAPIAMPNTPYYPGTLYYENTAWDGEQPIDPVYPEIMLSESVTVLPGGGPNGENVLDFNPAGTPLGEDYVAAALVVAGFGPIPDPSGGPSWWDATQGCISVSYQWTTAAWDQAIYNPLLVLARDPAWWQLGFSLSADITDWYAPGGGTQGTFDLYFPIRGSTQEANTFPFTRAATENQWQALMVQWKNGTTDDGDTVAPDGWLRVYWNGALIYDFNNIQLVMSVGPGGKPNLMQAVGQGYYGLFGPTTNLEVVDTRVPGAPTNNPPPSPPTSFGSISFYHTDTIGSVRMVTDANQQATRHDYLPFGQEYAPPAVQEFRLFAGKERDVATGFDYFGARYYASGSGRFTTVDPVVPQAVALQDPQLWNRYGYARNNPLRYTDPDGRCIWDFCIGEIALAAGVSQAAVGAAMAASAASVFVWNQREEIANSVIGLGTAVGSAARTALDSLSQASSRTRTERYTQDHLTREDLVGASREVATGREHGGQHEKEVREAAKGLRGRIDDINQGLSNPNLEPARRQQLIKELGVASRYLDEAEKALRGEYNPR